MGKLFEIMCQSNVKLELTAEYTSYFLKIQLHFIRKHSGQTFETVDSSSTLELDKVFSTKETASESTLEVLHTQVSGVFCILSYSVYY